MVDDAHDKIANFLTATYDIIFLVKMSSTDAARLRLDGQRRGQGCNRLIHKAKRKGKRVVMVNEAFTSQMCLCCGHLDVK